MGNFYAPGWHVVGAFMVVAGIPAVTTELIAQTVGVLLYPVGGYLFGRQLAGRPGALLGAAIFLYAPFRFYELFEQGNISQFIAMGLMPWVLWALARCAVKPRLSRVATAGLLLAALTVMHSLTGFEFLPFAGLYAILAGWAAAPQRYRLIAPLAALALGVMIAAVYWLPALTELQDVRVQQAASGLYDVQANFVPLGALLGPNQTMDRAALNPPRPFNAGQPGLLVAGIGLIAGALPQSRLSRWQRAHLIGGTGRHR
ncbi:MAG: 6-pyruvoyl-tetrahydropterin synthase-related protein [Aggregatilineales bacterium]